MSGLPGIIIFLSVLPPTAHGADEGAQPTTSKEELVPKSADGHNSGATTGNLTTSVSSQLVTSSTPIASIKQALASDTVEAISANPGAINIESGTGLLSRLIGFDANSGVRLGGLWIGNADYLFSGGIHPRTWSFNSLLLVDLNLDAEKLVGIPGGQLGAEFLQFNGQAANSEAGAVMGYDGLTEPKPLVRTQLYQLWWRQRLFGDKLVIRVGKSVPTYDFNNVSRPVPVTDSSLSILAVTGLIYTPVFINPTLLGAMPGYYNSAYGITTTYAPTKNLYLSYAFYDGALASGIQTGLREDPVFNGYYFHIGEAGYAWLLGAQQLPGLLAFGGWAQTGELSGGGVKEDGARGFYTFGSQRLWRRNPGIDNSGISSFFQFGINDSRTLIANEYFGLGFTGFGLVPGRPVDSIGIGLAWSWLNRKFGFRSNELMIATYYQMHLVGSTFFQPTLSYIPNPGVRPGTPGAVALTSQVMVLF